RRHYGNQLSGGEQQMLAIGRALMLNPRALMLDEPLEGLAPMVAEQLMQMLARLMTARAMTVIIVEQNPQQVLPVTDRAIVLEGGRLVHQAASADLLADPDTLERWLTL
ncbi:MAG TPA: ATP-binding cassette domain-containing protein, partial [Burkholderiaceae bacterium]|nr:ATP-binding cassette domain-containing protein [Burkholderiaceae bacterium]